LNTQYPDPLPSIAECKQCGHGIDLDKHLKIQKALATHDYEALDDLSEQAVKS
jgi:ribosomal protein S26